jgi:hypothetical protein
MTLYLPTQIFTFNQYSYTIPSNYNSETTTGFFISKFKLRYTHSIENSTHVYDLYQVDTDVY